MFIVCLFADTPRENENTEMTDVNCCFERGGCECVCEGCQVGVCSLIRSCVTFTKCKLFFWLCMPLIREDSGQRGKQGESGEQCVANRPQAGFKLRPLASG